MPSFFRLFRNFTLVALIAVNPLFSTGHEGHSKVGSLEYIPNQGQFHENVRYKLSLGSEEIFLEKNRITYHLMDLSFMADHVHQDKVRPSAIQRHAVRVAFLGSNPNVGIQGKGATQHYYNYFKGKDRSKWTSGVRAYEEVQYRELYNRIDLHFYSEVGSVKYDFVLHSGSNPNDIQLQYEGADKVRLHKGRLIVETSLGDIEELNPYAYQVRNGKKVEVDCTFKLEGNRLSFKLGAYDEHRDLIIDPTVIFSTYSGSSSPNFGYTATFDSEGFLYSGSSVFGSNGTYPISTGAFQSIFAGGTGTSAPPFGLGGTDVAITKWDTSGTSFLYSTFLGGNEDELPHSLVVNSRDELYILGTTGSSNFPTHSRAYDTTFNGGVSITPAAGGIGISYTSGCDLFVSKLNDSGTVLLGSTYLGGTNNDGISMSGSLVFNYADEVRGEIDVDQFDNVMIASTTNSLNFPTTGSPFQGFLRGNQEAVVVKMENSLNGLVWSSFLGGSFDDAAYSLAIRSNNDIVVTGGTNSTNFPNSVNTSFPSYMGGRADGFIAHISANGQSLIRSTYYGTTAYDQSYFVEVDKQNNVYLFGQTEENWNALIQNATYNTPGSGQFISKLNNRMDSTIWSTRFGTSTGPTVPARINISPTAFLVDLCNAIYLSGWGGNTNTNGISVAGMDTTADAFQKTTDGSDFYLMVMADDASSLKYGSFYGGSSDEHVDGGTSRFDRKGKVYQAVCAGCPRLGGPIHDFPTTQNAYSDSNLAASPASCNLAVFKMDFNLPIVVSDFQVPLYHCLGDTVDFNNNSLEQSQTNFLWDFGDMNTSTQRDPRHVYASPGNYFVQLIVSDTGTCNLGDTMTKQVIIVDDTTIQMPSVSMCYGDSLQIGYQPLFNPTYNWTPGIYVSDSTIARPYATAPDTTDYIVLLDNGVCVDTVLQTVFVDSSVTAIFTTPNTFCLRDSLDIANQSSPFVFTSYEWDFGNGDTSLQRDPYYTYTSPGSYTVRLVVKDSLSCNVTDTSEQQVLVIRDSVYALPPQTFCPGDSFQIGITPVAFQPYLWIPGNNLSDSTISNPIAFPDTSTSYVLLRDNGACYDSISIDLVQDSAVLARFNAPTEVCAPFNINFLNTSQFLQGSGFIWDFGNGDTTRVLSPNRQYDQKGVFDIRLIVYDSNSCNKVDSNVIQLLVDEDSTYAIDTVVLCNGIPDTIGIAADSNYTYSWSTAVGLSDSTVPDPTVDISSFQLYELYIDRGACTDTAIQPVDVDSIFVVRGSDTLVCSVDGGIYFELRTRGTGADFLWASHPLFIDTLNASRQDSFAVITPFNSENTYYIKTFSEKGCEENDTIVVRVGDLGVEVSDDAYICFEDSIDLEAYTTIAGDTLTYSWGPTNEIIGPVDQSEVTVNPLDDMLFFVRTVNTIGCQRDDSILVEVSDLLPERVIATTDQDTLFPTQLAQLNAQPSGYQYVWRPGIGLSDSLSPNPQAAPGANTTYELNVIDPENGECLYKDSLDLIVRELNCGYPDIFVPNAFTPNGDGKNEKLFVFGRFIKQMRFIVYNRWGEEVFSTDDQTVGWDGSYKDNEVFNAVFTWYLEGFCEDDQRFEMKGNVTVIR